jgi:3D (Asp-Asp-Asp) domain-containing protein
MTPLPRPRFSHAARAIRARIWQRIRLQFAAMSAVLLWAATLLLGVMTASEGRWVTVEATAYCPCELCCDERTERTANGTNTLHRPFGVASSPDIRLGSMVFIPTSAGYLDVSRSLDRWFHVDDRGGALTTEWKRSGITRLDLRYRTHASAKQFGRKLMLVFITN